MRRITIGLLMIAAFAALSLGCSHSGAGNITGSWTSTVAIGTAHFDALITFNDDNTFLFKPPEEVAEHNETAGQYEISDNKITFTDDDCGNSGIYLFNIADNRLSLIPDDEPCDDRLAILEGTWARAEAQ